MVEVTNIASNNQQSIEEYGKAAVMLCSSHPLHQPSYVQALPVLVCYIEFTQTVLWC